MVIILEWLPAIAAVITSLLIPFAVNLCTTANFGATTKRIVAIIFSILGGVAAAIGSGFPTPETLVVWCLAVVGGVQVAYTAFKAVGVTNKWLDALVNIGVKPKE
jgi:hypothetical protein